MFLCNTFIASYILDKIGKQFVGQQCEMRMKSK